MNPRGAVLSKDLPPPPPPVGNHFIQLHPHILSLKKVSHLFDHVITACFPSYPLPKERLAPEANGSGVCSLVSCRFVRGLCIVIS
jgi:hypothetical protein